MDSLVANESDEEEITEAELAILKQRLQEIGDAEDLDDSDEEMMEEDDSEEEDDEEDDEEVRDLYSVVRVSQTCNNLTTSLYRSLMMKKPWNLMPLLSQS